MEDMWKHRAPPHTLSWSDLSNEPIVASTSAAAEGIKDQRALSLKDSFNLFISR